jgi:hypothetical protein
LPGSLILICGASGTKFELFLLGPGLGGEDDRSFIQMVRVSYIYVYEKAITTITMCAFD